MKRIIFDFDGTLVDSRKRLFKLFSDLESNLNLTFDEYWSFKRNGESNVEIANRLKGNRCFNQLDFEVKWMALIEDDNYLKFDNPFDGVTQLLEILVNDGYDLWLLTARQLPSKVENQLLNFGWYNMFSKTLVTRQVKTKKELLLDEADDYSNSIMIGDSGIDIATAQEVGAYSIAVLSGFLNREKLEIYNPNEILFSVTDLISSKIFCN